MASESINILIGAEDVASAKLRTVGQNVEQLGTRVKQTSGQLKGGVQLAGSFAAAFGGSAFGSFANEMATISERVSAFSEISKTGAAGAFALRASLVAAVGIGAFKIGSELGKVLFQTEQWTKALDEATAKAEKLNSVQLAGMQKQFANARQDIDLIGDPDERKAAMKAREKQLLDEKAGVEAQVRASEKRVAAAKKERDAWSVNATFQRGEKQAQVGINEKELAQDRARLEAINAEWQAVQELNGERAQEIEATKAANAAKEKSSAFIEGLKAEVELLKATKAEQLAIEAARNTTPEQRGIAEALLQEREALKAKADEQRKAEQESEQAARKEADAIERASQLEKKRTVDLEARRIELEKGREAAAAYRLEQDGLSRATAERLAAAEEQQKQFEETASKAKNLDADNSPQNALQGRFLRGGTGGDPMLAAANKTVASLEKLNTQLGAKLDKLYDAQRDRGFTVKTAIVP